MMPEPFRVTEQMLNVYGTGWQNENSRIDESGAAGVGGARRTAGILALVEDPDFQDAMREYLAIDVEKFDQQARAYGWEIGHGQPLSREVEFTEGNPFVNPSWRDAIYGNGS